MSDTPAKPRIAVGSDHAAIEMVQTFLGTPFAGGRHQRRLDKITAIEREEHDHATPRRASSKTT